MNINQKHLNHIDAINLGSYYTPEVIVDLGLRDNSGAYFFNIWQIILFRLFLFWPR